MNWSGLFQLRRRIRFGSYEDMMMSPSVASEAESDIKEYEEAPEGLNEPRERLGLGLSLRDQEYLKHSSLFSRQQEDDQPSSGGTYWYIYILCYHSIHYYRHLINDLITQEESSNVFAFGLRI